MNPEIDDRVKIIEDGKANYTVVYPDAAPSIVMRAMNSMIDEIYQKTGVRLETRSDYLRRGMSHDSDAREILIGRTNYSETEEVLNTLVADQYAIRQCGNKIVIAAPNDSYILSAVNYLISDLLSPNLSENQATGTHTLFLQEYTLPSANADEILSINGKYIYDYSIVYETERAGFLTIAEQLRDVISDSTGYRLKIYADTEQAEGENEFLIGNTNRALSIELCQNGVPRLMTYEVIIQGDKTQILCGGPFSAKECISNLRFSMFSGDQLTFADGSYYKTDLAPASAEFSQGTDLRIMTSNILAARWGEDSSDEVVAALVPPVEQRAEIYAAVLANYQPDSIGVQETDHKWVDLLPVYLEILKRDYGLEYTWLFSMMDGKPNLTSLLYRSDRLELTASGCQDYSFWEANRFTYHLRVLAWGKFRFLDDPSKEFILLNTHWSWESQEQVDICIREEIELIGQLKAQHHVPIFCTGDFNNRQDSENLLQLIQGADLRVTMQQAQENQVLVNYCGGCGTVGTARNSDTYIDHILSSGNYRVLRYETVVGNRVIWLSDHAPQYADIQF